MPGLLSMAPLVVQARRLSITSPNTIVSRNGRGVGYHGGMTDRQNVLVIEVEEDMYGEIAPVLERNDLSVDRFPTAPAALGLVTAVSFTAIILNHPPKTMPIEDFVAEVTKPDSASRDALIGVFVSSKKPGDDLTAVPKGVKVVIGPFGGQEHRDQQLCKLLGIVPRAAVRVKVNTDVTLVDRENRHVVTRTRDLSTSGFFAVTNQLAPVGSRLKTIFSIPGDRSPFVAQAEVVRHALDASGDTEGMGLRFISFRDGSLERLSGFLESMYAETSERQGD